MKKSVTRLLLLAGILASCGAASAAEKPRVTTQPPGPERRYVEARTRWNEQPTNTVAGWQVGRACFDWAEYSTNDTQRAALANEGIEACRKVLRIERTNVAAHFYLGLNLGQLAQTKLLGALRLVDEMEELWKKAIALNPRFDFAGPHRALGILYRDAPGWPTSIGSRSKARQHLLKAVELAPEYPGNRLSLLESYAKWGERRALLQQAGDMEKFLEVARTQFTGEAWKLDWQEWDRQWERIKAQVSIVNARSPKK